MDRVLLQMGVPGGRSDISFAKQAAYHRQGLPEHERPGRVGVAKCMGPETSLLPFSWRRPRCPPWLGLAKALVQLHGVPALHRASGSPCQSRTIRCLRVAESGYVMPQRDRVSSRPRPILRVVAWNAGRYRARQRNP